ncbi:fungal-specific transcription factor domain-containing protein [Xylariomycetidae sp. FL2044]|nr:fungal-specific transcription factor domain-containing protein [Xylariomycetidae sp. FL2044]
MEADRPSPGQSRAQTNNPPPSTTDGVIPPVKACDVCRKRKSRCVRDPGQPKCVLCAFHDRDCTYSALPRKRRRQRVSDEGGEEMDVEARPPVSHVSETSDADGASLLDRTLGLHRSTHSRYVGSSSLLDPLLLNSTAVSDDAPSGLRLVGNSTLFVSHHDRETLASADDYEDLDAIEQIVRPHGPALVRLYFRIVHPSYPILHKGVFLEKYARSYREFSPPLLAAVYLLALDWWEYDGELASQEKPDAQRLVRVSTRAMTLVIHRPKLSTVQAGLLALQRSDGDSWVLTTQLVGIAQELGLHIDCSSWNIPDWEKGLRRRLSWAVFMQDKWGALIYGRPSHIVSATWQSRRLCLEDFPESAADEDDEQGSTEVEKGRLLFIRLAALTEIMSDALELLHGSEPPSAEQDISTPGIYQLLDSVKPIAVRLKHWVSSMPTSLGMDSVRTRKLCSNGYLHLSYFATEITIHRQIIRTLQADAPPALRGICRDAARERLDHGLAFVESLRPEHLQGFWWFASSKCLALIGVYGALLQATSATATEAEAYGRKLDDFRWSLKVRAKGSNVLSAAIRELDDALGGFKRT